MSAYSWPPRMFTKLPTMLKTLSKFVGPLPRDGESCNCAGARSADAVQIGILRNVVLLVQHRHQFVAMTRAYLSSSVLFPLGRLVVRSPHRSAAIRLRLLRRAPRIDEDGYHHRNLAPVNQIVHHVLCSDIAVRVFECLTILKNHQRRRSRGTSTAPVHIPNMYVECQDRSGSIIDMGPAYLALGDVFLRHGVRT